LLANIVLAYYSSLFLKNETLPIINKPKDPKKGGIQGTRWKDPRLKRQKMNHLSKTANHKGNIKFPTNTRADPTPTQAFASSQVRGGKAKIFTSCS
jgi:hypothetical protein